MTLRYKTEVRDTHDGKASYGAAFVQMNNGAWSLIGHTKDYRTYPRAVRARAAADALCRQHANWPSLECIAQGMEIIEV